MGQYHDWCSTIELPRQLQWDVLILYTDFQAFAPRPLGLGITSVDRQATLIGPDVNLLLMQYTCDTFRTNGSSSERETLMCLRGNVIRTNVAKNQHLF